MADNNNLEIVISASDQASAMLESINAKLDKLAQGAEDTEAPVKSLGERFDELTGNLENATQPLADATKTFLAIEAGAVALGAALVKVAIDQAGQFEQSLTEINTILKLSPEALGAFEEDILQYAQTSTQSLEQINAAIYNAVSAGVKYEDALKALAVAEQLAVGGNASLEESIKLLTATTNAYGPALDGAGEAADIFFKTVELGVTTIPELNASLGNIVPVAAALGVPLEEVGAALATLTANGIGTAQATTGIKAALDNIISPSKGAQEAAAELGVEFNATALQSKGLVGFLESLVVATGGNAEKMKALFGSTEAYTAVMSLTNDRTEKLKSNLDQIKDSAGAAQAAFEKMKNTLNNVNQTLQNAVNIFLKEFGEEVLENYKGLITSLAGLFNTLGDSIDDGAFDVPIGIIKDFLDEFAGLIDGIAAALPEALAKLDWSGLQNAVDNLKGSFGSLFDGLDLTKPDDLAKVIQNIIDIGNGFINATSGIVEGIKPLIDGVIAAFTKFGEVGADVQVTIGYIGGLATTINTVAGAVSGLGGAIAGAGGLIAAFSSLNPVITAAATTLAAFKVGEWFAEWSGLNKVTDAVVTSFLGVEERAIDASEAIAKMDAKLKEISQTTGVTVGTMDELDQAIADGRIVVDATTGAYRNFTDYLDDWGSTAGFASESAITLAEKMRESGEMSEEAFNKFMAGDKSLESLWATMDKTSAGMQTLDKATKDITQTAAYWGEALDAVRFQFEKGNLTQAQYSAAVKAIDDAAKSAGVELVTMADQQGKNAKSTKDMAEASEKFALEWEKILSAERTAIFEASADIQVAQIEADAERAVAAMEMLSASFQSTGDVLTELIGLWAGLEGLDQQQITEWIEREYEIREQLAQAQIDLVQAEIARMEAQTRLLERGGVELTIQSDGLEPELEAFMFKIIDRVRVAVAGSYEEFLLGCGAGA